VIGVNTHFIVGGVNGFYFMLLNETGKKESIFYVSSLSIGFYFTTWNKK
jgi:phosphatidate phosphatase APP1